MALTAIAIKNLKPKDKNYVVTDAHGLILVVSTAGTKIWRYRYRYNGKQQTLTIGHFPAVSLQEAREKAHLAKMRLKEGYNPAREKKLEVMRRRAAGDSSFEAVARRMLEQKGESLNAKYHKQTITRMEQHVFPYLGQMPIDEISIPDVVMVVEAMGKHGTIETAKRMQQVMSQTFRYAAQRGLWMPISGCKSVKLLKSI